MEPAVMGRVNTEAKIENLGDLFEVERKQRSPEEVRRLVIPDALVDSGATTLALPSRLIQQLGLKKQYEKRATSSRGTGMVAVYEAVRLTIQDRFCTVDVMEVPDEVPVLIGQIPLEMLDFVADMQGRRLTGNPAHGGEHVLELY
jgi:predicted aspartyl protease